MMWYQPPVVGDNPPPFVCIFHQAQHTVPEAELIVNLAPVEIDEYPNKTVKLHAPILRNYLWSFFHFQLFDMSFLSFLLTCAKTKDI